MGWDGWVDGRVDESGVWFSGGCSGVFVVLSKVFNTLFKAVCGDDLMGSEAKMLSGI